MGNEDLEAADDLGEGNALVLLPVLDGLLAVGEDHEVILLALEVDLDLGSVSAHVGGIGEGLEVVRLRGLVSVRFNEVVSVGLIESLCKERKTRQEEQL